MRRRAESRAKGHARSIICFQNDIAGGIRVRDVRPRRLVTPDIVYRACLSDGDQITRKHKGGVIVTEKEEFAVPFVRLSRFPQKLHPLKKLSPW